MGKFQPTTYEALLKFAALAGEAAANAGLDARLVELVRIRVSQINGCAFCLQLHTRDALSAGETTDRLAVLPAWAESSSFSASERAALQMAESITRLADSRVESDTDVGVAADMTAEQIAAVAWLVTAMNALNRLTFASRYPAGG